VLAYLLLASAQLLGILMIPFGGPGVWVQLAGLALYGWGTEFAVVGKVPLLVVLLLALVTELLEPLLVGSRVERGLRRRLGVAGLAGGAAGALAGYAVPLLGIPFAAFAGALFATLGASVGARREPGGGCLPVGGAVLAMTTRTAAAIGVAAFAFLLVGA
jgi:hypothetical protein